MIKRLIIIICLICVPYIALATVLDNCEYSTVQSAINAAGDGDTIELPSCTTTWSSGLTVDGSVRSIHLKGNGQANTIITPANWSATLGAGKKFQLSDMKMVLAASGTNISLTANSAGLDAFRIFNMTFQTGGADAVISVVGTAYGLFDNITLTGGAGQHSEFLVATGPGCSDWASSDPIGTRNAIFIENSNFTYAGYTQGRPVTDVYQGGRIVFRYNTLHNVTWGGHSTLQGSTRCSGLSMEVYNNVFEYDNASETWMPCGINAGEVVYHNNNWIIDDTWVTQLSLHIERASTPPLCETGSQYKLCSDLNQDWSNEATVGLTFCTTNDNCANPATCKWLLCSNSWTLCDGDEDCGGGTCNRYMDGGSGNGGRPCFNAPGTGVGGALYPSYEWNNTWTGTGCGSPPCDLAFDDSGSPLLDAGTDYYDNTAKPGYTAYTCPHPLTGLSGSCSTSVAGLTGYNIMAINPPTRLNAYPAKTFRAGTTSVTMSLNTDISSTCKYGTTDNTYANLPNFFSTTGETTHSQLLTGLSAGAHKYHVKCDAGGNPNLDDFFIEFGIAIKSGSIPVNVP